jgi:hypothetical protein
LVPAVSNPVENHPRARLQAQNHHGWSYSV